MKKIILFLVDSMMPDVVQTCIAEKKAPALQFFGQNGECIWDCVTAFPTMTASVDCSLITGVYPDEHKVPGLVWFDPEQKCIIDYINGASPVYHIGLGNCATNVLYDLNEKHLSKKVQTIHEALEEQGFRSGSINVIAHRGPKQHKMSLPLIIQAITGFQQEAKVSGPTFLSLGTLVQPNLFRPLIWNWSHGAASGYGINDPFAIDMLIEVIRSGKQPDFTIVYLPDNDHKVHRDPAAAVDHLAKVDQQLVRFLDSFDSWEQAMERNTVILVSDHGQTRIGQEEKHNVPVDELLSDFTLYKLGTPLQPSDEVVVCNNERMGYIYPLYPEIQAKMVEALARDSRLDLIAWKEDEWTMVRKGGTDQVMRYRRGGPLQDPYGSNWTVEGEVGVLDLRITGDLVRYEAYPDAMARLYGALHAQNVPVVVVNAAPGYELLSEYSPTHLGGGSHGSLHKQDSLIPLIVAGASRPFPRPARLIDIKTFILQEAAALLQTVT